jgi:hypothetical protein
VFVEDDATTFPYQTVLQAAINLTQVQFPGSCFVQRIEPAPEGFLTGSSSGTVVRLTLRGSTDGEVRLEKITMSQPVSPSGVPHINPYDSAADLTVVAASPVVIPASTPPLSVPLTPVDTGPLGQLTHTDIVAATHSVVFISPAAAAEAETRDRTPTAAAPTQPAYLPANRIFFIEKIEVG